MALDMTLMNPLWKGRELPDLYSVWSPCVIEEGREIGTGESRSHTVFEVYKNTDPNPALR